MTQPIISERIGLTVVPDQLQLAPGSTASVALTVENRGSIVDQFGLVVEGLDPTWYSVRDGTVNLFPGMSSTMLLDLHLPEGLEALAGDREVLLKVLSREAPNTPAVVPLAIEVLSIGALTPTLMPLRVTVGWRGSARFTVAITNESNAERILDLLATDPDEAMDLQLRPDRLSVAPGANAEVVLVARPRKRPLLGSVAERTFSVTLTPAEALVGAETAVEPVAVLAGEVVYRPPMAWLAAMPPGLRRALLALAALAALAALLIWFLGAPGRRGPLIERAPVLKPAVAALENALNLPDKVAAVPDSGDAGGGSGAGPRIAKFELQTPGSERQDYALVWEVDGADKVAVDGQPQPDAKSGSLHLDSLDNHEYVLEASKGDAKTTQSIGIVILRPPVIQDLKVDPPSVARGQPAKLTWATKGSDRASLDGQQVLPSGSQDVSPTATTSYTLVVENELGRAERSVEVRVTP